MVELTLRQDAEQAFFLATMMTAATEATLMRRTTWAKRRSQSFFEECINSWNADEWKRNFRVSRATFQFLCLELTPCLQRSSVVRKSLSVEKRVAITLWRLGTNIEYRSLSHLFGVGLSTVCVAVSDVCSAIVEHLASRYIAIPAGERLKLVVDGFMSKWGVPQCVGAIDSTHIPIIAPKDSPLDYYNRKGYHSVVLQALVDHEYKFLDIYVGWPGSVHDARVLVNSGLYSKCDRGSFPPNWPKVINGTSIPLFIIGDPAYPLTSWLIKPFSDCGRLTTKQQGFNYHVSRARCVVENAFGRLKGRWRSLMKRNDTDIRFLPTLATACCVLHNICEIHGDNFNDEWLVTEAAVASAPQAATSVSAPSGDRIRAALCDYFDTM